MNLVFNLMLFVNFQKLVIPFGKKKQLIKITTIKKNQPFMIKKILVNFFTNSSRCKKTHENKNTSFDNFQKISPNTSTLQSKSWPQKPKAVQNPQIPFYGQNQKNQKSNITPKTKQFINHENHITDYNKGGHFYKNKKIVETLQKNSNPPNPGPNNYISPLQGGHSYSKPSYFKPKPHIPNKNRASGPFRKKQKRKKQGNPERFLPEERRNYRLQRDKFFKKYKHPKKKVVFPQKKMVKWVGFRNAKKKNFFRSKQSRKLRLFENFFNPSARHFRVKFMLLKLRFNQFFNYILKSYSQFGHRFLKKQTKLLWISNSKNFKTIEAFNFFNHLETKLFFVLNRFFLVTNSQKVPLVFENFKAVTINGQKIKTLFDHVPANSLISFFNLNNRFLNNQKIKTLRNNDFSKTLKNKLLLFFLTSLSNFRRFHERSLQKNIPTFWLKKKRLKTLKKKKEDTFSPFVMFSKFLKKKEKIKTLATLFPLQTLLISTVSQNLKTIKLNKIIRYLFRLQQSLRVVEKFKPRKFYYPPFIAFLFFFYKLKKKKIIKLKKKLQKRTQFMLLKKKNQKKTKLVGKFKHQLKNNKSNNKILFSFHRKKSALININKKTNIHVVNYLKKFVNFLIIKKKKFNTPLFGKLKIPRKLLKISKKLNKLPPSVFLQSLIKKKKKSLKKKSKNTFSDLLIKKQLNTNPAYLKKKNRLARFTFHFFKLFTLQSKTIGGLSSPIGNIKGAPVQWRASLDLLKTQKHKNPLFYHQTKNHLQLETVLFRQAFFRSLKSQKQRLGGFFFWLKKRLHQKLEFFSNSLVVHRRGFVNLNFVNNRWQKHRYWWYFSVREKPKNILHKWRGKTTSRLISRKFFWIVNLFSWVHRPMRKSSLLDDAIESYLFFKRKRAGLHRYRARNNSTWKFTERQETSRTPRNSKSSKFKNKTINNKYPQQLRPRGPSHKYDQKQLKHKVGHAYSNNNQKSNFRLQQKNFIKKPSNFLVKKNFSTLALLTMKKKPSAIIRKQRKLPTKKIITSLSKKANKSLYFKKPVLYKSQVFSEFYYNPWTRQLLFKKSLNGFFCFSKKLLHFNVLFNFFFLKKETFSGFRI